MKFLRLIARFFLDIIETIVVALAIFVVIYLFLVQPHQVNGNSMWPNFLDGEYLLTDKFSYRFNEPQRADVIIFQAPQGARCPQELHCDFVKRVIGLPGEEITLSNGEILVNGSVLNELYLPDDPKFETQLPATAPHKFYLAEDEYFVLGDNRSHSSDSRAWGPVPERNIVGRAWLRYWPPQRIGFVDDYKSQ